MKAYKCDRCGAYYDGPSQAIRMIFGTGSTGYDVCPSCYKEVEGYLKNEKVEEMYTVHADNETMDKILNKKEEA